MSLTDLELMKRIIHHIFDEKFRKNPLPFIFQSALASIALAITFYLIWNINPVVVAGIGSTTFVLFVIPESTHAKPRSVIGGHLVSMFIGVGCYYIPNDIIAGSLAVGFSILVMTATDTEHAPAASTALGVAVQGFTWELLVFIVAATTLLSLFQRSIHKHLQDLV